MSQRLDSRILCVDEETYLIEVYVDKLLIAPCLRAGTSLAMFAPQSVVTVIPLAEGIVHYLPLGFREDEARALIRLHVLAFDARRQKGEG